MNDSSVTAFLSELYCVCEYCTIIQCTINQSIKMLTTVSPPKGGISAAHRPSIEWLIHLESFNQGRGKVREQRGWKASKSKLTYPITKLWKMYYSEQCRRASLMWTTCSHRKVPNQWEEEDDDDAPSYFILPPRWQRTDCNQKHPTTLAALS